MGLNNVKIIKKYQNSYDRDAYNPTHPKRAKKAKASVKKLKTIAGRLIREIERKLSGINLKHIEKELLLYKKALTQTRMSKDKLYSLHKPFTTCIAKGKAHKKYEFGNKIGLFATSKELIITGIKSFFGNPHDSKTIEPLLKQVSENMGFTADEVVYDRGGKGVKNIGETKISTPDYKIKESLSPYEKKKKRKKFRRRAAIEPVIGHLKSDFRMQRNYLHGESSPQINAFLAAAGWNLKKMMAKLKKEFLFLFFLIKKREIYILNLS